jgi:hypothetical protein
MRWLARLLLPMLQERVAIARRPNMQLDREDNVVYLRRWWVIPRNKWFNVYLHHMIGSDDDVPHDHPYWSMSLVLTDGLRERYLRRPQDELMYGYNPDTCNWDVPKFHLENVKTRRIREGQIVWRGANFAHQLIVDQPAWTLFVTGPRVREWGFWCQRGWIPWQEYYPQQKPGGADGRGARRGCGETP